MTVTSDGLFIESDPGMGILAPGWHGTQPGGEGDGNGGDCGLLWHLGCDCHCECNLKTLECAAHTAAALAACLDPATTVLFCQLAVAAALGRAVDVADAGAARRAPSLGDHLIGHRRRPDHGDVDHDPGRARDLANGHLDGRPLREGRARRPGPHHGR